MKPVLAATFLLICGWTSAQNNPAAQAQPIVEEGRRLYRSEMASWYGTDLFLAAYDAPDNIGGYFSYSLGDTTRCVFFSRQADPVVIGTVSFDSTYRTEAAQVTLTQRPFSLLEFDLYQMRARAIATADTDPLFKHYEGTNYNFIPLVTEDSRRVYVLTGPTEAGVVMFGNDYLLAFSSDNNVVSTERLHGNLIPIEYGDHVAGGKKVVGAMHSHLPKTGNFITATDVCTLMLYASFAEWKTHTVVSEKYLNLWNCERNELTVMSREVAEKISKKQRRKKRRRSRKD